MLKPLSDSKGSLSAMKSSTELSRWRSPVGTERRIPGWARGIVAALSRDEPKVVTRRDVAALLAEAGMARTPNEAIGELRRLGWLVHLGIAGAWTFIPPGQAEVIDPYLDLRAWDRIASPGFYLCGANAAWFLGYLDRAPDGKVQVLLPRGTALPKGLRAAVSAVSLQRSPEADLLQPTQRFLVRRRLDLLRWSDGLPCIGPDALAAQLALRPASFGPWDDLVAHLARLVEDIDDSRLVQLLEGSSAAAWQRAAYLLHAGGAPDRGGALLDVAAFERLPVTTFVAGPATNDEGLWFPQYGLLDRLIHPTQALLGKA